MKIYRVTNFACPYSTIAVTWAASKREALKLRAEETKWTGSASVEIEQVEIPTTRAGLIEWLNHNFITDNG